MSDAVDTTEFLDTFRARGAAIADACTRCGDCFRACPMDEPAALADADPGETAGAIVDLITGGEGSPEAIRWADVCSGSGNCIPACQHGINPRFMVQLARGFARRNAGSGPLPTRWRQGFQTMSRGVRILSRLQLPPEALARVRRQSDTRRDRAPGRYQENRRYRSARSSSSPRSTSRSASQSDATIAQPPAASARPRSKGGPISWTCFKQIVT